MLNESKVTFNKHFSMAYFWGWSEVPEQRPKKLCCSIDSNPNVAIGPLSQSHY